MKTYAAGEVARAARAGEPHDGREVEGRLPLHDDVDGGRHRRLPQLRDALAPLDRRHPPGAPHLPPAHRPPARDAAAPAGMS